MTQKCIAVTVTEICELPNLQSIPLEHYVNAGIFLKPQASWTRIIASYFVICGMI